MAKAIASVNGRLVLEREAVVSVLDRGFTLSDGLFETMVGKNRKVLHLDRHLNRLENGSSILGLELPSRSSLTSLLEEVLDKNGFSMSNIRLTVSRGYDYERGLQVHKNLSPTIVVRVSEQKALYIRDISLAISPIRRNEGSPLSNVKTLAYTDSVLARKLAIESGYDDAIMLNNRGDVACATSSNFFLLKDGLVLTPPLSDGVLPGITRSIIIEEGNAHGFKIQEKTITPDFKSIDGAFITNVVTGLINVGCIDGFPIGSASGFAMFQNISNLYQHVVTEDIH